MTRDDRGIRLKLLSLTLGSLCFIAGVMGPTAVMISARNDAEFERRIAHLHGARLVLDRQQGATEKASAEMGLIATALLAFTVGCGLLASRSIITRLTELTSAAKRMQQGDFDTEVRVEANTELDHVAAALERMRAHLSYTAKLLRSKVELEKELEMASLVQRMFLPRADTASGPNLHVRAFYRPAARCGGDFWWSHALPDGSLLVLVGDVTGHGTGPAMLTAAMSSAVTTLLGRGMGDTPEKLMEELSRTLRDICAGSFLSTLSAVRVDAARAKVEIFSAGAPPVLVAQANGDVQVLTAAGSPLGELELTLGRAEAELPVGARVLVFSDGVVERTLASGAPLGMRRLRKLFAEHAGQPLDSLLDALSETLVHTHTPWEDDMTFVIVEHRVDTGAERA